MHAESSRSALFWKSQDKIRCAAVKKNVRQQTPRRWGWGTPLKKRSATGRANLYYIPPAVRQPFFGKLRTIKCASVHFSTAPWNSRSVHLDSLFGLRNGLNNSIGNGRNVVVLCSFATSRIVCK